MSNTAALLLTNVTRKQGMTIMCVPQIIRKVQVYHHNNHIIHHRSSSSLFHSAYNNSYNLRVKRNMSRLYATFVLAEMARLAKMQSRAVKTEGQMKSSATITDDDALLHEHNKPKFDNDKADSFLSKSAIGRTWDAVMRMSKLALLFAPSGILFPMGYLFSDKANLIGWNYTVYALEKAGPTFIKLSQWASTRSDLFGEEATRMLSKLRDKTSPHTWNQTAKLLREELGNDWDTVLHISDQKPIGSGCIAQVYSAELSEGVGALPAGK